MQTTGEISFVVRSEHPGRAAKVLLQLTTNPTMPTTPGGGYTLYNGPSSPDQPLWVCMSRVAPCLQLAAPSGPRVCAEEIPSSNKSREIFWTGCPYRTCRDPDRALVPCGLSDAGCLAGDPIDCRACASSGACRATPHSFRDTALNPNHGTLIHHWDYLPDSGTQR